VVHPANFTFKIPDHLSYDECALVEPLAVGMHSCTKAQIKPGDVAIVIGAGPIGMLTAMTTLASGAARCIIVDTVAEKVAVAESLVPGKIQGIVAIPGDNEKLKQDVYALTGGEGAEVVIECSGNPHAAAISAELACPAGVIVYVGCPVPFPIDLGFQQVRELRTEAVFRYAHMYPKAISMLDSGAIDVKPIITDHFDFEDSVAAFDFMCDPPNSTVKSIIHMPE
jgi:D-xylulose reductase